MPQLTHDDILLEVDPRGAYIRRLEYKSKQLFFPYTEFDDGKIRGGMHVCLPNFGPAPDQDLNQHGFGREALWQLATTKNEPGVVRCRMNGSTSHKVIPKRFEGLYVRLVYSVTFNAEANTVNLAADLTVLNRGRVNMNVAPAFHPYFSIPMLDTPHDIAVITEPADNVYRFNKDVWAASPIIDISTNKHAILDVPGASQVVIGNTNLPQYVCWSDGRMDKHNKHGYVCVEPTSYGFAFADPANVRGDLLRPGAGRVYNANFSWVVS
jgi:D-hexose-6-phosphate mutarotase